MHLLALWLLPASWKRDALQSASPDSLPACEPKVEARRERDDGEKESRRLTGRLHRGGGWSERNLGKRLPGIFRHCEGCVCGVLYSELDRYYFQPKRFQERNVSVCPDEEEEEPVFQVPGMRGFRSAHQRTPAQAYMSSCLHAFRCVPARVDARLGPNAHAAKGVCMSVSRHPVRSFENM